MEDIFISLIDNEYLFLIGITSFLFGLISKIRQQREIE